MIQPERYIGKPFEDGGRGPESYDCWGLVVAVCRDHLGLELPSYGEVSARDLARSARLFEAGAADEEEWDAVTTPRAGDVVLMRSAQGGRRIVHVGVMADSRRVLHCEEGAGVVLVPRADYTVAGRIIGFRRHRSDR